MKGTAVTFFYVADFVSLNCHSLCSVVAPCSVVVAHSMGSGRSVLCMQELYFIGVFNACEGLSHQ